jgi:long-chain acyl-CoA synthetase
VDKSLTSLVSLSLNCQRKGLTEEEEEILFGDVNEAHPDYPSRQRKKDRSGNILVDNTLPLNPLDHSSNPTVNKLRTVRATLEFCPQLWSELAKISPDQTAIVDDHLCDEKISATFSEMDEVIRKSAAVFQRMGVKKGVNVAVLGENSARWLMVDHGIQLAGGASAVRGADAPMDELRYIYEHSESAGIAVLQGPKLLNKLYKEAKDKGLSGLGLANESHGPVKNVILMHKEKQTSEDIAKISEELGIEINFFADLLETTELAELSAFPKLTKEDLATIVYTSGTTGSPKGVMLTHGNLLHQISHRLAPTKSYDEGEPLPGESMVSLLPVWHITERTFELWMLTRSCKIVYSTIRYFKPDMAKHKPEWLVLVPRVLEKIASGVQDKLSSGSAAVKILSKLFTKTGSLRATHTKICNGLVVADEAPGALERLASKVVVKALSPINAVGDSLVWSKVQDGFGGNLKTIISGGSALAGSLETFYETAGINILVGYGLTECSPLLAFRRSDNNMVTAGCCGKTCMDTEVRVVDPESKATAQSDRRALPIGEIGVVIGRGPQVMKGYYNNPEATAKAIDQYGWFDTGDLGRVNPATGDLILTGRAKDTIVLSNGENIEPQPLEDAILGGSDLIEQVMLTGGQDGRKLVAIVVLSASELANAGYLTKTQAEKLQAANEAVNDPKCTKADCKDNLLILKEASDELRGKSDLQAALVANIKQSTTTGFRAWERVNGAHITLEPFGMANGQLTQSYKVKRASVMERYGDEI